MNLKEITNRTREWKVIGNTHLPCKEKREMIGGIYEEHIYYTYSKTVTLWKDKKEYENYTFNLPDLQEATPLSYKGQRICIGDEVKWCGAWYEVYDYCWDDGVWKIHCAKNKDYNNTWIFKETEIEDHKPLHPNQTETIEIGGIKYNRKEVEDILKDIKPME